MVIRYTIYYGIISHNIITITENNLKEGNISRLAGAVVGSLVTNAVSLVCFEQIFVYTVYQLKISDN